VQRKGNSLNNQNLRQNQNGNSLINQQDDNKSNTRSQSKNQQMKEIGIVLLPLLDMQRPHQ
jgi:hypothetical protein